MPVSILKCTPTGPLRRSEARRTSRAIAFGLGDVVDDRRELAGQHLAPRLTVVAAHDQKRHPDARFAQLDRLFEERHAKTVDARALERARHRGRAVTVGVGLEHAEDA